MFPIQFLAEPVGVSVIGGPQDHEVLVQRVRIFQTVDPHAAALKLQTQVRKSLYITGITVKPGGKHHICIRRKLKQQCLKLCQSFIRRAIHMNDLSDRNSSHLTGTTAVLFLELRCQACEQGILPNKQNRPPVSARRCISHCPHLMIVYKPFAAKIQELKFIIFSCPHRIQRKGRCGCRQYSQKDKKRESETIAF
jgi:hypothetical protein